MKKRTKMMAGAALMTMLVMGGAMTSMAAVKGVGQWCEGLPDGSKPAITNLENGNAETNWWFIVSQDGKTADSKNCAANTWLWISGKCYYFNENGWMVKAKDGKAGTIVDNTGATYYVDESGAWTDANGVLMTNTDDADEWTKVENLISGGSSAETTSDNAAEAKKPEHSGSSKTPTGVPEGEHIAKESGKTTGSKGDKPDESDHSNNSYQLGAKSGTKLTNAWANYSIELSGWTSTLPEGNTDTIATDSDGNIISIWFDNLGSRSYDSFVKSRVDGSADGTEVIGGVTYNKYKDTIPDPSGSLTNYNYVRQIGNAVMVIETQGNADKINKTLAGMTAAN